MLSFYKKGRISVIDKYSITKSVILLISLKTSIVSFAQNFIEIWDIDKTFSITFFTLVSYKQLSYKKNINRIDQKFKKVFKNAHVISMKFCAKSYEDLEIIEVFRTIS